MNKIIGNFISCFILKKRNRKHFRQKYITSKNSDNFSLNITSLYEKLNENRQLIFSIQEHNKKIEEELSATKKLLLVNCDITKLPTAQGNLKLIQDSSVSLLNHFNNICKKYDIKYWLDSGTLIGYLRHKGFIPWDDDIDICMMREDYEKLFSILDREFQKDGFTYAHGEITRLYYKKTPAQIDIFPIDTGYKKIPIEGEEKKCFIEKLNEIKSKITYNWEPNLSLQKPVCSIADIKDALSKKDYLYNNHSTIDKGFLFYGIESCAKNRCLYSYNDVFPLRKVNFKGISSYIPNNYEYWLFTQYGDYMAFPLDIYPKHDSIINRLSDKSFKDCQELIKKYLPKNNQ